MTPQGRLSVASRIVQTIETNGSLCALILVRVRPGTQRIWIRIRNCRVAPGIVSCNHLEAIWEGLHSLFLAIRRETFMQQIIAMRLSVEVDFVHERMAHDL